MMVLGYPAIKPPGKFLRPLEAVVHWNRCAGDEFRSDNDPWQA
jgi:hypothetical protein